MLCNLIFGAHTEITCARWKSTSFLRLLLSEIYMIFILRAQLPNDFSLLLQVKKKRPGRDGKMAGLVPVLYVSQS